MWELYNNNTWSDVSLATLLGTHATGVNTATEDPVVYDQYGDVGGGG